jgi:hypothetical protein
MSLPKITYPQITLTIPSSKKKIKFRPFLVKEEKILLMAKLSEEESDILLAIKQVVNNCAIDEFDVNTISLFDLEYIFIQLRAASVNDTVQVSYKDNEDQKIYEFEIKLKEIKVNFPEKVDNKIKITDTSGILMKYPNSSLYEDKEFLESGDDSFFQLILRCVDKVYDENEVYEASAYTKHELEDYIENLDIKTFEKIQDFMINQPKLSYVIKYKNSLGNDREIELTTLSDFFTLR